MRFYRTCSSCKKEFLLDFQFDQLIEDMTCPHCKFLNEIGLRIEHNRIRGARKRYSTNKSGVTGVCWIKRENRWKSSIWVRGSVVNLGRFDDKKDAVMARYEAEEAYGFQPKRRKISDNNSSKVRGVSYRKNMKRWIARISFEGKDIYLGSFIDKKDAIKARRDAERDYL